MSSGPISESGVKPGRGCGILVCLVIGVVGLCVLTYSGNVASRWYRMQSWVETPCTILTARMDESRTDDGKKYRADFTYEYQIDGVTHVGDRGSVTESHGNYAAAIQRLKKLHVGTLTVCWVDPNDPADATLERDFPTIDVAFLGVIGLIFSGVGFGILIAVLRHPPVQSRRQAVSDRTGQASVRTSTLIDRSADNPLVAESLAQTVDDEKDVAADVPQRLKPTVSKWWQLVGAIFVCLFWNGIVSVFVYQLFVEPLGWFSVFLGVFLIPFVLVGLLLVAAVFHTALSIFNPDVSIALSSGAVARGGSVDVAWEVGNGLRNIDRLHIAIIGKEWAQYQQGTDTRTDESVFEVIPIVDTAEVRDIAFGTQTVSIPATAMHSMHQNDNRIQWAVRVRGEIGWWPDVSHDYEFRVKPALIESGSAK